MITKENTIQIKGVAILCMIIFHLFGFPNRLPDNININWLGSPIIKALQICVPIYLFIAGYGLQCTYQDKYTQWKDIRNRIKKIYTLFWWIAIPFISLGIVSQYYKVSNIEDCIEILLNICGIKSSLNGEWWFFSLYIELLILFFYINRLKVKLKLYLSIMLSTLIVTRLLNTILPLDEFGILGRHIKMILINLNIFMMGCFFSKYDIFLFFIKLIDKYNISSFFCIFGLTIPIIIRAYIPMIGITELICVPIFILGIIYMCKVTSIAKVFQFFGKRSMNLWLIHSFFIYYYLNKFTFISNSPIIMLIIVIVLSLACSFIIENFKKIYLSRLKPFLL